MWIYDNGFVDSYGVLYDSDLNVIASNDDSGLFTRDTNFHIRASLDPGIYYLAVSSFNTGLGQYRVRAETVGSPGTINPRNLRNLRESKAGTLTSASDTDRFRVNLGGNSNVVLFVKGITANNPRIEGLGDVNEYASYLADEFLIRDNFSGSPTVNVSADSAGTYTIQAFADHEYSSRVRDCTADSNALIPSVGDDLYACQWHLKNRSDDFAGEDINVEPVWADTMLADGTTISGGIKGDGVNVVVVDDGMDTNHPDLDDNVNRSLNHDYGGDNNVYDSEEHHGTGVAGVIAARDNSFGVRGVAPRAKIFSHNFLAHRSDYSEADSMSRNAEVTAVSNNSWGPIDGPGLGFAETAWEKAVEKGIREGYGGKGVFYAFAAGNGALRGDDANLDEVANFYAVTAVYAVNDAGRRSDYSEAGASLWVCAPSNTLMDGHRGIWTTENSNRYRDTFGGTSAATPQVSGVAALMRHANPELTWRDIKLILAATARKNHATSTGWETGANKYGSSTETYNWNREYGFGVVDAKAAVDAAKTWLTLAPLESYEEDSTGSSSTISDAPSTETTTSIDVSLSDTDIEFIEFVEVRAKFTHQSFRDLEIELSSPASGSSVKLLSHYESDDPIPLNGTIRFGASRFLGEDPDGSWTLTLRDKLSNSLSGSLDSWTLKVYGHKPTPFAPTIDTVTAGEEALTAAWSAPTQTRGGDITSYDVLYKGEGGDEEVVEFAWNSGDGALQEEVTGLTGGVEYIVQVRARNSSGVSQWSEAATGTPQRAGGACTTTTGVTSGTDLEADCNTLLGMRDELVGSAGTQLNWSPSVGIFQWDGVTSGLRVTALELSGKSLAGRIPTEIRDLTGLTTLDLSDNDLTGSIPNQLGALTDPNEPLSATNTAKLSALTTLRLNDNDLSGGIPSTLWNLTTLTELRLDGNRLTGSLPSVAVLERMDSLRTFNLSANGLSGSLPVVPSEPAMSGDPLKLQSLSKLDLSENSFSGSIPARFGSLSGLTELRLNDNSLGGSIPMELGSLSSLTVLDLSGNSLSQAIPLGLGDLSSLRELLLADNRLTGAIPVDSSHSLFSLEVLDLSENQLTGSIPAEVNSLSNLGKLYLNDNRLGGEIPTQLETLAGGLMDLYLADNRFTGCVPSGLRSVSDSDVAEINLVHCDLYLDELVLSHPDLADDVELSPAFDTNAMDFDIDRTSYSATVGPSPLTVTPTGKAGENVTFRFLDSSNAEHPDADGDDTNGHQVALESGRTTIKVEVTSEDGKATHTYTLSVSRPGSPGRPTFSDTDVVAGESSLTVSWTAPTSTGGTGIPIISYDIQHRERATGGAWTVVEEAWTGGTLETTISPLIGGVEYEVQVRAYNGACHGSWSSTVRGTPNAPDCSSGTAVSNPADNPGLVADCEALLAAKAVLEGTSSALSNWSVNTALSGTDWTGVTVEGTPPRVAMLELRDESLDGRIPSSLGQLLELTTLDLSRNSLTGPITPQLGNLSKLQSLELSANRLTGPIPTQLGSLSMLSTLKLDNNALTGSIPSNFDRLSNLEVLTLDHNRLTGRIPTGMLRLAKLKELILHQNQLTGSIPSAVASSGNLEKLILNNNRLTGRIPTQLGNATMLSELHLNNNQLTGSIPTQLNSLTALEVLRLNENRLDSDIPDLSALAALVALDLSLNQLTGGVPSWLKSLTSLEEMDLSANRLEGLIPAELGELTDPTSPRSGTNKAKLGNLTELRLGRNDLSGRIPSSLGNLTTLLTLDLSANDLTGEIPTQLGDLAVLQSLVLSSNELTGPIPGKLSSLTALKRLWLNDNRLTGAIPSELNSLTNLELLALSENGLTASIPSLSSLTELTVLALDNNGLTGSIPDLGALTKLRQLNLQNNELEGAIPSFASLSDLEEVRLYNNQLTGSFPTLPTSSKLRVLEIYNNRLSGSLPTSWSSHGNLRTLSASRNQFTGGVPSGLSSLSNLTTLSLWRNPLGGTIPGELSELSQLRTLLLFENQLTGSIPTELGDLTNLTRLHLDENELTGEIPTSLGNLQGLQELFLGKNPGLTGCVPGEVLLLPVIDDGRHDIDALGLPLCPTPTITSVEPADGSLTVQWDVPAGFDDDIRSYDLRHIRADADNPQDPDWALVETHSTSRSRRITGLENRVDYKVQVRAVYELGTGAWSDDDETYAPQRGVAPRRTPTATPPPTRTPTPTPNTNTGGGGGGGGGGGAIFAGGGGGAAPQPTRPVAARQTPAQLFQPLVVNGSLKRVWRFFNNSKRWLFYDPRPGFAPFNTIRTVSVDADEPPILLVNVDRRQQFRGYAIFPGWNFVPVEPSPPPPSARNVQRIQQLFLPLIRNGTLDRVWRLNPRTQGWELYDPDPAFAALNTLSTVDLAANPPVVLTVLVTETQEFRGTLLHRGWNYILMR